MFIIKFLPLKVLLLQTRTKTQTRKHIIAIIIKVDTKILRSRDF